MDGSFANGGGRLGLLAERAPLVVRGVQQYGHRVDLRLCELRGQLLRDEALAAAGLDARCTVYVGGLDMYTDVTLKSQYEAELGLLLGEFGTVNTVEVRMEQGVLMHTWALVSFSRQSEAQSAASDAPRQLSRREQHRTHRLQGSTQLGTILWQNTRYSTECFSSIRYIFDQAFVGAVARCFTLQRDSC